MRAGKIEEFAHLSNFKSLKDFNNNIEMFLAVHKKDFTKGEYIAFMRLTKYCAKVKGVANCKIQTLVSACMDTSGGVSRSTAERMIRKAKKLGILTVHNTVRKKGGYAHNVFVFNRFEVANNEKLTERKDSQNKCESKKEPIENDKETDNLVKTNNIKINNKRKDDSILNSDFVPSYVSESFISAVKPFFNDAKEIYRLWGKVRLAHKISRLDTPVEELLPLVIQAFKGSVFAYKQNKVKKAFTGYFFGGLRNVFAAAKRREAFQHQSDHPLFYNFLEA
jgi:hypothetical protein